MKKIYLFLSLLLGGLLLGNVQTMNAAVSSVAGVSEMLDGDINPPGSYGYSDPGDAVVFPIEAGHQIIIASEYWGNFNAEQQVSRVIFETAKPTAEYPAYINNHYVVKIYEGGQLNGNLLKNGNSNLIDKYRGTLVYEQEYTQKAFGVQTVELKQPYTIKDSTCFWIAIEAKDNTLFKKWRERNGDAMASTAYKNYVMGANFKYLYTRKSKTSDGEMIDFLFLNGVAVKSTNDKVIPHAENYLLAFCVSAATAPSVTPSVLAFEKEGGEQTFDVLAATLIKEGWSATTDADWLTLSIVEGPGAGAKTVVAVTAAANNTGKARNATIAITQGTKIQTIKVSQDNISTPGFYGDAVAKTIAGVEANTSVILCPEQFGTYKGGQKVSAVKFYINDPSTTSSYKDYTNKDITIKIYEGSAVNADFAKSGKTKNIDECLGKLVKSYPYTVEKYGPQTVNFEDKDQYEIQDGVTFWIALEFPGKTLMVYDKEVLDTSDSYTAVEAYKLSNHKYLITTFSSSVLYLQDAFAATKVETRYQIYNKNFYFQFQLANPTVETRTCDIAAKLYDYTTGSLKTLPQPIVLSGTDDLAKIAPRYVNYGPDTVRAGNLDFTISLGDVNVYHLNKTYNINPGTGNYTFTTEKDVTYTAQQMNDLMLYGEFDMKLAIQYDGYDPDLSNNVFVATVNRERPTFDITLEMDSSFLEGAVLKGAGQYKLGEEYTITAELMPGIEFIGWYTKEGYEISKDLSCTFLATENRTFCAKYKAISYNVEVSVNADTAGTACCSRVAKYGEIFDVIATPKPGFVFVNWTENGQEVSTDATYIVKVTNNRNLVANFIDEKTIIFDVTAEAVPAEGGTVEGAGKYSMNSTASLKAIANDGYRFVAWIQDDKILTKDENYSFTVTDNVKLTANFEKIPVYTVTVTINPDTTCGFVTGAGSYREGAEVTLEAVANNKSYRFLNWMLNDSVVSTASTYVFTVMSDCKLIANFELIPYYEIMATVNPEEAGTVTGAGSYMDGATAILTATPNDEKYVFACWTEGEDTVSTENVYTFMVNGNRNLVANFTLPELPKYTVNVTINPEEGGSVEGAGVYTANDAVKLVATANEDYKFVGWTENGDTLTKDLEYSFVASADRELVANFVKTNAINDFVPMNVNVYPNPSKGNFHVNFGEMTGKVVYQLVDVKGTLIATEEMMLDGQSVIGFNYDLPQGTYFVRIVSGQQNVVKPVVIVR